MNFLHLGLSYFKVMFIFSCSHSGDLNIYRNWISNTHNSAVENLKLQEEQLITITLAFFSRHEKGTITYNQSDQFPIIEISRILMYSQICDYLIFKEEFNEI